MLERKKMGLALVCSDGRLQQECVHYNKQLAEALGVDLVDFVALPGPDGLYKRGHEEECKVALASLRLLIKAHEPVALAIVGHYQCAGNPVENEKHDHDVAQAAAQFKKDLGFAGEVVALSTVWHSDQEWSLKQVSISEVKESQLKQKTLSPIQFSPSAVFNRFRLRK